MAGLSRREFLASVAALSVGWQVPAPLLGDILAAPVRPTKARSTLVETIRLSRDSRGQYRTLVGAAGEPYLPRVDLLGRSLDPARSSRRRSLAYLGHFSDIHVMDAQSPARLEPMQAQSHDLWAGAFRPQDPLTIQVTAAMVAAVSDLRTSPLTGAPMTAAVVTGDSADMISELELRWYIDVLDGGTVTANSGAVGIYDGVQAWPEASYAYHPDDPGRDVFGANGFPAFPGMLTGAVATPVPSVGLPVPWYSVYGNHDALYLGTLGVDDGLRAWAIGDRKAATWPALAGTYLGGLAADISPVQRLFDTVTTNLGRQSGIRSVTPDPARRLFDRMQFMSEHLNTRPNPGPIGHGFTPRNIETSQTWWSADLGPYVRAFGLDTCNHVAGPDGAVPDDQFTWLRGQLEQATRDRKLAIILSHHNSLTLENSATPVIGPSQTLHHAEEFIAMLLEFPVCVAWLNGHTHVHTIQAHPRSDGGGLWEITTASCIDFPQQQQLIEFVDNRDGTLSLFTTVVDHASPAVAATDSYDPTSLAAISRELSANDWVENPTMRLGSPLDRNTELLLPAPFELASITDADLEREQAAARARLVAYERGWPA